MNIEIKFKNKKLKLNVNKTGCFTAGLGLMFRTKNTPNLLFDLGMNVNAGITSVFVFFPFLVLWLDERNNVIEHRIVKPFRLFVKPRFEFRKFIEIPQNKKNRRIIKIFVDKGKI